MAEKIYTKLVNSKLSKGYSEGETKEGFVSSSNVTKDVIELPQLLNPIEDYLYYLESDEWLGQEKKDGERRGIKDSVGLNRNGLIVDLPKNIALAFKGWEIHVDSEIIGETLHVFDLLSIAGDSLKERPCEERIRQLEKIYFKNSVKIVKAAYTTKQKKALFNKLKKENKEGIVFKKKDSIHEPGRPSSGGNQVKYKFYKTATFIVANHTPGKRSVGLEMLDGKKKVSVGKVTIPPNQEIPKVGDLVEVRYLYAYRGGSVYQPTYLGKRVDLYVEDAILSQLVYKSEE